MINQSEKQELLKQFKALDKDSNGKLSKEELMEAFLSLNPDKQFVTKEVDKIMQSADMNQSGQIDFSEFITASMEQQKLLSKQRIETAFQSFDIDKNGVISRDELETIMGGFRFTDQYWKQILDEIDGNKDGQIQLSEFINLLESDKVLKC